MSKKKPNGYWSNVDNIVSEARKAMAENGWDYLPGNDVLNDKGYGGLGTAISKHQGGYHKFRELLGQEQKRIVDGTWKNLEYTIVETKRIMVENGWNELPSTGTLREKGYGSLVSGIKKHHGGFPKFRKLLGQEQLRKENGTWNSVEYILSEARKAMQEQGWEYLPGDKTLRKKGY